MTESPAHPPRARRFPLTRTALAGSAIAVPLYIAWYGLASHRSPAPDELALVETPAIPAESPSLPLQDVAAAPENPAPKTAEGVAGSSTPPLSPPPDVPSEAATPSASPAPEPPAGAPWDGGSAHFGKGSSGPLAEARRASAPAGASSGALGGGMGAPKRAPMAARSRGIGALEPMASLDDAPAAPVAVAPPPVEREEKARDDVPTIRAGQLTAGALSDLESLEHLDELRTRVVARDATVAAAIPDHKAKMSAPDGTSHRTLEVGLVLDTTGSMGDEIEYLKAEVRSIAETIQREYPQIDQRFALVAYRDHGDDYVVRSHGFAPLETFVQQLGAEWANGGGDFPEAMDAAMTTAGQLPWSGDTAAKVVFLVADAPPHQEGYRPFALATGALARSGVSVYPVASSGVEIVSEYLMRWAARTTGGRYLFLTDHSGIGHAHAAPQIDQYELKPLRDHMLDVLRDELGRPAPASVVVAPTAPEPPIAFEPPALAVPAAPPPTWFDRHGTLVTFLGTVFLFGFAGDMALAAVRRRRRLVAGDEIR